jgi:hypothetical protein
MSLLVISGLAVSTCAALMGISCLAHAPDHVRGVVARAIAALAACALAVGLALIAAGVLA